MSFSQLNNVSLSQNVSEKNVLKKNVLKKKEMINKDKVLNSETFASFKLIEYVGGKV